MPERPDVIMENVRIVFPNFSGKAGKLNAEGQRNFNVVLPPAIAEELTASGWNVRTLKPKDLDDSPEYILKVNVKFNIRPPKIMMITNGGKNQTPLDASNVNVLDFADIERTDLIVVPYHYDMSTAKEEKRGISAYVKEMYVTIRPDPFGGRYSNPPDSAANPYPEEDGS